MNLLEYELVFAAIAGYLVAEREARRCGEARRWQFPPRNVSSPPESPFRRALFLPHVSRNTTAAKQ